MPTKLASASALCKLLSIIDDAKHCPGNLEPRFLEQWRHISLTLQGHSGTLLLESIKFLLLCSQGYKLPISMLLSREYRAYTTVTANGFWQLVAELLGVALVPLGVALYMLRFAADEGNFWITACQPLVIVWRCVLHMHIYVRYKPLPRLWKKIATAAETANIVIDEETHNDLVVITTDSANSWITFHLIHFSAFFGNSKLK